MPRRPRVVLPNHPHHLVQRGHNRQAVFVEDSDFLFYLSTLREWKNRLACRLHAYCLMTNHVHLVVDPGDDPHRLGKLMKRVAGRYTQFVNRIEGRTGSAWEGRYRSSPIDSERYLLACCRYIELNPCRGGLVARPEHYRWSSYREKIGVRPWIWLDPDMCYLGLGDSTAARHRAYEALVLSGCQKGSVPSSAESEETRLIRVAVSRGQLTGDRSFVDEIERRVGRRIECRGQGRPSRP